MQVLQTVPVAESTKKLTLCLQSNFSVLCTTLPLCNFVRSSSLHLVCMPGKDCNNTFSAKVAKYRHTQVNLCWVDLASTCNLAAAEVDISRQRGANEFGKQSLQNIVCTFPNHGYRNITFYAQKLRKFFFMSLVCTLHNAVTTARILIKPY